MNNSYMVEDGKVFVSDHDGVIKKREYTDNIKQILIEENILERMQDEIEIFESILQRQRKIDKKIYGSKIPLATLILQGVAGIFVFEAVKMGNTVLSLIGDVAYFTFIGVCADILRNKIYKAGIKEEERYYALKELEVKQKDKVQSLKNEETKNNINNNVESTTLDHKQELENLNLMIQEYIDYTNINSNLKEEQAPVKKLVRKK